MLHLSKYIYESLSKADIRKDKKDINKYIKNVPFSKLEKGINGDLTIKHIMYDEYDDQTTIGVQNEILLVGTEENPEFMRKSTNLGETPKLDYYIKDFPQVKKAYDSHGENDRFIFARQFFNFSTHSGAESPGMALNFMYYPDSDEIIFLYLQDYTTNKRIETNILDSLPQIFKGTINRMCSVLNKSHKKIS